MHHKFSYTDHQLPIWPNTQAHSSPSHLLQPGGQSKHQTCIRSEPIKGLDCGEQIQQGKDINKIHARALYEIITMFTLCYNCTHLWSYILQSISIEKVRFHEKSMRELALDMRTNIYPPSVMLEASGREATCDAVLSVKISGTDEELESEILLKKPDPGKCAR